MVTIGVATSGATIRYTTDGTTPTASSPVYGGPISVTRSMTIRAIAMAGGMTDSAVASATYTLRAVAPAFNPPGGNYLLPQLVQLSSPTPNVTIYYTTDGSTPTTSSTRYVGAIPGSQDHHDQGDRHGAWLVFEHRGERDVLDAASLNRRSGGEKQEVRRSGEKDSLISDLLISDLRSPVS